MFLVLACGAAIATFIEGVVDLVPKSWTEFRIPHLIVDARLDGVDAFWGACSSSAMIWGIVCHLGLPGLHVFCYMSFSLYFYIFIFFFAADVFVLLY